MATLTIGMMETVSAKDITIDSKTLGGLKKAVETVENGGTIYLKDGVYKGESNTNITIGKNINIRGLGSNVILDGQGKKSFFTLIGDKASLKNLKFRNGYSGLGGAIGSFECRLIVDSCTFTNNKAKYAGAISSTNSTLTVINCTFTNNRGTESGGAIDSFGGNVAVSKSTFKNNKAGHGAAISSSSDFTVSRSTFTNNKATESGGAIFVFGNSMKITNTNFKNNIADKVYNAIDKHKGKITTKNVKITPKEGTKVKK